MKRIGSNNFGRETNSVCNYEIMSPVEGTTSKKDNNASTPKGHPLRFQSVPRSHPHRVGPEKGETRGGCTETGG